MAASRFHTHQYSAENFVESAGAVLFHLSSARVCLVHLLSRDEYLLAKGRRRCGESRLEAALREVTEETGYQCQVLPVTMATRATPPVESGHTPDVPRTFTRVTEPFSLQIRHLSEDSNIKLIWWFIAAVNEAAEMNTERPGEEKFDVKFFNYKEALEKLTFQYDREILRNATELVRVTYGWER